MFQYQTIYTNAERPNTNVGHAIVISDHDPYPY